MSTTTPIPSDDGVLVSFSDFAVDRSRSETLRDAGAPEVADVAVSHALEGYRALARSLPQGFVMVFDEDLRLVIAEGLALSVFGLAGEGLAGRPVTEVLGGTGEEGEDVFRAALEGQSTTWEQRKGRHTFKLIASRLLHEKGSRAMAMVVANDVTVERAAERRWAALHAIAASVTRQAEPRTVADSVCVALAPIFGFPHAAVVQFTGADSALIVSVAPPLEGGDLDLVQFERRVDATLTRVWETGRPARVDHRPGSVAGEAVPSGLRVVAAVPIRNQGSLWGAVCLLGSLDDTLDDELLDQLTPFADTLEISLGSSSVWTALTREASTDVLTGLPNRRAFEDALRTSLDQADRHGSPLSLALLDLDNFKAVNDEFGHEVGDAVLADFGRRMLGASRESEMIARIGGEEFGWILPGTSGASATLAADRLRRLVAEVPFGVVGHITVSVGVSSLDDLDGAPSRETLLGGADAALYEVKRGGRDGVARHRATRRQRR